MPKKLKRTPNPPSPGPTGSASWWITNGLPDDEITVLIRLKDDEWPVVLGWHEDGQWRDTNADEVEESLVTGWMHLHEAATILDAQNAPDQRPGAADLRLSPRPLSPGSLHLARSARLSSFQPSHCPPEEFYAPNAKHQRHRDYPVPSR
jgi:hypothetical protein